MAATTPPAITPAPTPAPQRGDRATFSARVDAFVTWITAAVSQFAALASNAYANAVDAFQSATTATSAAASATSAAASAFAASGAAPWVSGQNYAANAVVISQINFQAYRRTTAGAGTTDPASDGANWVLVVGSATNGAFVPVAVPASNDIDLRTGNYFTLARSASTTVTFSNCPSDGYSFAIKAKMTTGTLVLPSNVYFQAGTINTMDAGKTHRIMLVTEDRGAHWAAVLAANFDF